MEGAITELPPKLDTVDGLQVYLFDQGIRTQGFELLNGGYTSTVYRATIDGERAIIKHARHREKFYPTYEVLPETRVQTEVDVLTRLHPIFPTRVPKVLAYFPENDVVVMTDVGQDAQLGFPYFIEGKAEPIHAQALGKFLGELRQATADWEPFPTIEDPFEQMLTRGLEAMNAYPQWAKRWKEYYLGAQKFLWPDGHPKNVLFGNSGEPLRAIDFDCSHFADPDYMLPNFFGQLPVFAAFAFITPQQAARFTREMIEAYIQVQPINSETERKMLFYAGAQTIQRQDGKWLFQIASEMSDEALKRKAFIFYFGRHTITAINSFDQYIDEVASISPV